MDFKKVLELIDKNVNQEQLAKDLGKEFVLPFLEEKLAKVDIIPGTDIDNKIIMEVLAFVKKLVE